MSTVSSAGFIAEFENTEQYQSNNTTTNVTQTASGTGSTAIGFNNSSNNIVTTTDFGAVLSAQKIAQSAISATQSGFNTLSDLTGRALLLNSEGIKEQRTPIGATVSKAVTYIIFAIIAGLVLMTVFTGSKKGST